MSWPTNDAHRVTVQSSARCLEALADFQSFIGFRELRCSFHPSIWPLPHWREISWLICGKVSGRENGLANAHLTNAHKKSRFAAAFFYRFVLSINADAP
jgi:hypothetical protein